MSGSISSACGLWEWQAGARSLSRELASPPIEVVLVEAAVAVIRLCRPPGSAEAGQHVAAVVPAAVISFLRRRVRYP